MHVKKHAGETLKCDVCDFTTNLNKHLKEHKRKHSDDCPYIGTICNNNNNNNNNKIVYSFESIHVSLFFRYKVCSVNRKKWIQSVRNLLPVPLGDHSVLI